jgi:hypothetical protein
MAAANNVALKSGGGREPTDKLSFLYIIDNICFSNANA